MWFFSNSWIDIALNERQLDLAKSTKESLENINKVFDENYHGISGLSI